MMGLKSSRRKASRKRRMYAAQNGICLLCGRLMRWAKATREHVVPRHLFRKEQPSRTRNIFLSHTKCNRRRADQMPTDFDLQALSAVNIIMEASR